MSPTPHRRRLLQALAATLAATALAAPGFASSHDDDDGPGLRHGKLFTSTNAMTGNEVLVYAAAAHGPATLLARASTQGLGTGAALGSQGAVTLSRDGRWLFVVNAASNTVSTFEVGETLMLRSVVDSRGLRPTSVTEHGGQVWVLNAGGDGGLQGFRNRRGQLEPMPGGTATLSAAGGTAPAQVSFSDDGDLLVVSERTTSRLTSFRVRHDGTLAGKTVTPSSGAVPFGFAFTKRDVLIVSEAAGSSVSSYRFDEHSAQPRLVTASLPDTQGAACWVAVTPNGRLAFAANAASSSVSSFAVAADGSLTLRAAQEAVTGPNSGALDLAVSRGGGALHVLANRSLEIVSYRIEPDGLLVRLGSAGGMPAGSVGLAAN